MNKEIKNIIKNLSESKQLKTTIFVFGVLFVVFLIFQAGMFVGLKKGHFNCNWGENYYENFGSHRTKDRGNLLGMMDLGERFPNANGANGKILKLELPTLIVQDLDNTEKIILINDNTKIITQRHNLLVNDLKVDDFVVVIGSPNDNGQIEAKLIRLMPVPPTMINQTNNIQ